MVVVQKTNEVGLAFESRYSLHNQILETDGYFISKNKVYKDGSPNHRGVLLQKHELYKWLSSEFNIDYSKRISKKLLPDEAYLTNGTLFILEKKIQNRAGSVDEKLQTCDFKLKQYKKLLSGTGINVEYCYILSEWFQQDAYRDVLEYIEDVGCSYCFESLPLYLMDIKK